MPVHAKFEYDFPTAVTFLLIGLGIGAVLALVFSPEPVSTPARRPAPRSREYSPAL